MTLAVVVYILKQFIHSLKGFTSGSFKKEVI